MRRMIVLALAATMCTFGMARADKSANAFVDPATEHGNTNGFENANSTNLVAKTYSVGAAKVSGCKMKVQFKGLHGFVDGEKLICLAGADACIAADPLPCSGGFGNSIVLLVPYSGISLKAQTKADFSDIGCGATDATSINSGMTCYKFDAGYAADPSAACAGLWIPNDTYVPGSEAVDGMVGACQFFTAGTRMTPPGTGIVARDGISTPFKP